MDFLQWWQGVDYAAKATVIGAVAAVLTLIVGFFVRTSKTGDRGAIVGNTIKGNNTITTNAPPPGDDKSVPDKT